MAKKTLKEALSGKEYTIIVPVFGNYKQGDTIRCHKTTGEALKAHKIVK